MQISVKCFSECNQQCAIKHQSTDSYTPLNYTKNTHANSGMNCHQLN